MTDDRARKKAVRRRMEQTGEKYTEARRALEGAPRDTGTERKRADDPVRRGQFRRFTEGARRVVVLAREEARVLRHDFVGTEHVLLGLLREEEGLGARVLRSLEITAERVHAEVVRSAGLGEGAASGQLPFTPGAKEALEHALREALSLGHNYIGTEHILLGLAHEDHEGIAARILLGFDAGAEKLRYQVIRILSGAGGPKSSSIGAAGSGRARSGVFERFSERAREVIEMAQRESHELGHDQIGDEHILLGLLREREALAGRALEALGITLEQARAGVLQRVPAEKSLTAGQRPFTPRAMRILELALREALVLGHNYIGAEHILLGLVRESEGTASAVLSDFDVDPREVRNEILSRLSEAGAGPPRKRSEPGRLTAQEEVDLAKRIERGDPEAVEEMVERNLHLVVSIAEEFHGQGLSFEELKRAGTRGLVRATDTFDYRRGFRFSRYATRWIRQAIVRALTERSG